MTSQRDYGVAQDLAMHEAELVPTTLRLYRHYNLRDAGRGSGAAGTLHPTSMRRDAEVPIGWSDARCCAPFYKRADLKCPTCRGFGEVAVSADGHKMTMDDYHTRVNSITLRDMYDASVAFSIRREFCTCLRDCKAPEWQCSCGFYASYSPYTDFFEQSVRDARANPNNSYYAYVLPPVFAVVEAAGRVLMGRKGVRAERMRVVAVAIDEVHVMAKYRAFLHASAPMGSPLPSPMDYALSELDAVSRRYDVPTFGLDIEAMIEEFPQPDLSQLIKNQE